MSEQKVALSAWGRRAGWNNYTAVIPAFPGERCSVGLIPKVPSSRLVWVRRHLVTKGSFYERLAEHGHEIVSDEDFARLYAEGKGRSSIPRSVMVKALLVATHDRT